VVQPEKTLAILDRIHIDSFNGIGEKEKDGAEILFLVFVSGAAFWYRCFICRLFVFYCQGLMRR
jgi:hypothetical protein